MVSIKVTTLSHPEIFVVVYVYVPLVEYVVPFHTKLSQAVNVSVEALLGPASV